MRRESSKRSSSAVRPAPTTWRTMAWSGWAAGSEPTVIIRPSQPGAHPPFRRHAARLPTSETYAPRPGIAAPPERLASSRAHRGGAPAPHALRAAGGKEPPVVRVGGVPVDDLLDVVQVVPTEGARRARRDAVGRSTTAVLVSWAKRARITARGLGSASGPHSNCIPVFPGSVRGRVAGRRRQPCRLRVATRYTREPTIGSGSSSEHSRTATRSAWPSSDPVR
jgi:hypothetical protein